MTTILTNKGLMAFWAIHDAGSKAGDEKALELFESAKFICADNAYFIDALFPNRGNASLGLLHDETGLECFVNHVHLEDFCDSGERLETALRICAVMEEKWFESAYGVNTLRQIVSYDDNSCVYRCHVVREGQSWVSANLHSYQELMVVIDSTRSNVSSLGTAVERGLNEPSKET